MSAPSTANEDLKLQFARQLYEGCLERHGEDHEQTRLILQYVATFKRHRLACVCTKTVLTKDSPSPPP